MRNDPAVFVWLLVAHDAPRGALVAFPFPRALLLLAGSKGIAAAVVSAVVVGARVVVSSQPPWP